jgi:hypothetical protein
VAIHDGTESKGFEWMLIGWFQPPCVEGNNRGNHPRSAVEALFLDEAGKRNVEDVFLGGGLPTLDWVGKTLVEDIGVEEGVEEGEEEEDEAEDGMTGRAEANLDCFEDGGVGGLGVERSRSPNFIRGDGTIPSSSSVAPSLSGEAALEVALEFALEAFRF